MMRLKHFGFAIAIAVQVTVVSAFQLAPLGSEFEAKLTNESPTWLSSVAGKVGVLIKEPVHEEITQLGYGCPVELGQLRADTSCKGADRGFASPYVIYGVRWNDLPPFRLRHNEGKNCKKFLTRSAACNVEQTVRFATQPECWYCMFTSAQKTAQTRKISGCKREKGYSRGNLLTRSHFGDLQFLHGMASEDDVQAPMTRQKMIEWVEFAWKVVTPYRTKKIAPRSHRRATGKGLPCPTPERPDRSPLWPIARAVHTDRRLETADLPGQFTPPWEGIATAMENDAMKSTKRYLFLALIALAVFIVINVVHVMLQSPEAKDQQAIADCWDESKGGNLTPAQQQVVVGACQALEKVYQFNYSPLPGRKDV